MTNHRTGPCKERPAARLELLKAEKELTRRSDELARRRQELPWGRIDQEYRFETDIAVCVLAFVASVSTTACFCRSMCCENDL